MDCIGNQLTEQTPAEFLSTAHTETSGGPRGDARPDVEAGVGRDDRSRGIAVTPSREAALSHSRGRSRGDGGCEPGPLARYRLAPRRRETTFGRHSSSSFRGGRSSKAITSVRDVDCFRRMFALKDADPTDQRVEALAADMSVKMRTALPQQPQTAAARCRRSAISLSRISSNGLPASRPRRRHCRPGSVACGNSSSQTWSQPSQRQRQARKQGQGRARTDPVSPRVALSLGAGHLPTGAPGLALRGNRASCWIVDNAKFVYLWARCRFGRAERAKRGRWCCTSSFSRTLRVTE
jgi:hypothetical protein